MTFKIKNTHIEVIQGDITKIVADALILPANAYLRMDRGLADVIKRLGGDEIEAEVASLAPQPVGGTLVSKPGKLPYKKIIHSVLMAGDLPGEEAVRLCCYNGLKKASEIGMKNVVVPAIGCGVGGFPVQNSAKLMGQEILKYVRDMPTHLERIVVCLNDQPTYDVFQTEIIGFIRHVVEDLSWGPYVTTDIIIELEEGIILVERSNPPFGWTIPGGFVDRGETLENAARREAKEETNLELDDLVQLHTYSDPKRDPRFHTVGTVFVARGRGTPQFGSDAKGLKIVPYDELPNLDYVFDHKKVVEDYLEYRRNQLRV